MSVRSIHGPATLTPRIEQCVECGEITALVPGTVSWRGSRSVPLDVCRVCAGPPCRPQSDDVHYLVDRGECVRVRGTVLPIYRLKEIFEQQSGLDDLTEGILIVVEVDGENSCLFVDEILGQQQVVIKALGIQGDRVAGVSGGAIMSDGRIALILDVATLVGAAVVPTVGA